jgi:hypothetical protein
MVKTALLSSDLETGSVALWVVLPEYEQWRIVLAGRALDTAGVRDAYGVVDDALVGGGLSIDRTPTITILRMSDPFIKSLRRMFAKSKDVEGMRLGGQMIGDRFIEDAYVYRIR